MNTVDALLDRAKEVLGLHSDYQLAKHLGLTTAALSSYRSGRTSPEPAIAGRIAEILGRPPLEVIAIIEEERESARTNPRPQILEFWRRYSPRIFPTIVAAVVVGGLAPDRTEAGMLRHNVSDNLYIMRTMLRALLRRMGTARVRPGLGAARPPMRKTRQLPILARLSPAAARPVFG